MSRRRRRLSSRRDTHARRAPVCPARWRVARRLGASLDRRDLCIMLSNISTLSSFVVNAKHVPQPATERVVL